MASSSSSSSSSSIHTLESDFDSFTQIFPNGPFFIVGHSAVATIDDKRGLINISEEEEQWSIPFPTSDLMTIPLRGLANRRFAVISKREINIVSLDEKISLYKFDLKSDILKHMVSGNGRLLLLHYEKIIHIFDTLTLESIKINITDISVLEFGLINLNQLAICERNRYASFCIKIFDFNISEQTYQLRPTKIPFWNTTLAGFVITNIWFWNSPSGNYCVTRHQIKFDDKTFVGLDIHQWTYQPNGTLGLKTPMGAGFIDPTHLPIRCSNGLIFKYEKDPNFYRILFDPKLDIRPVKGWVFSPETAFLGYRFTGRNVAGTHPLNYTLYDSIPDRAMLEREDKEEYNRLDATFKIVAGTTAFPPPLVDIVIKYCLSQSFFNPPRRPAVAILSSTSTVDIADSAKPKL